MENIIDTDNITVDYDCHNNEYRLSLFDTNMHYMEEIYLTPIQLKDIIEFGKDINIKIE